MVLVYDITERDSFDHIKAWMGDIERFAKKGVTKFLIGNKCDMEHNRKVTAQEGQEMADSLKFDRFLETSARDTINIDELFVEAAEKYMVQRSKLISNKSGQDLQTGIPITQKETKKEKNCGC